MQEMRREENEEELELLEEDEDELEMVKEEEEKKVEEGRSQ